MRTFSVVLGSVLGTPADSTALDIEGDGFSFEEKFLYVFKDRRNILVVPSNNILYILEKEDK